MALCNEIEAPICFNFEIIRSIEKQKFTIGIFFFPTRPAQWLDH
jgi:hypothetical protein